MHGLQGRGGSNRKGEETSSALPRANPITLGWIQDLPEYYTQHHSRTTTTTDVADNQITTDGSESWFDVLADV